ncbi:hypothetical protein MESS2_190040 [Mesorhizobium metallidurans STM 2683]|uniref:EAL domain-containing protein n=1 Tax=Mesorhizobium metallidurans STM 2683 TaxID=1297569 RepID=M5F2E9_9HYPH|nr:hypothetical protein MESS2_190040 [Mesorhizobium metallidurans STM 2683]
MVKLAQRLLQFRALSGEIDSGLADVLNLGLGAGDLLPALKQFLDNLLVRGRRRCERLSIKRLQILAAKPFGKDLDGLAIIGILIGLGGAGAALRHSRSDAPPWRRRSGPKPRPDRRSCRIPTATDTRIALDDFGIGYSSLGYLRRFPVDKIKIDRSFIRDIDNRDTAAIVCTVIGLGAQLGITVTAEGVETEAQLEFLRKEGCVEAQGYLIGVPSKATDIARLLETSAAIRQSG